MPGPCCDRWAALDKGRAPGKIQPGSLRIDDPYNGPLRLYWQGAFICGGLGGGEEVEDLLRELAEKLAQ